MQALGFSPKIGANYVNTKNDELPADLQGLKYENVPLPPEELKLYQDIEDEDKSKGIDFDLPLKTRIMKRGGPCSRFAGQVDYLVNTDRRHSYRVTIRTRWQAQSRAHENYMTRDVNAGSSVSLGCDTFPHFPYTQYWRTIEGEEQL